MKAGSNEGGVIGPRALRHGFHVANRSKSDGDGMNTWEPCVRASLSNRDCHSQVQFVGNCLNVFERFKMRSESRENAQ